MSEEDPKIVVDDDWKAQVEKEKAMATDKPGEETSGAPAEPTASSAEAVSDRPGRPSADRGVVDAPPPATFETLVTMLFTQALAALGQLPGPDGQLGSVNKSFRRG